MFPNFKHSHKHMCWFKLKRVVCFIEYENEIFFFLRTIIGVLKFYIFEYFYI